MMACAGVFIDHLHDSKHHYVSRSYIFSYLVQDVYIETLSQIQTSDIS